MLNIEDGGGNVFRRSGLRHRNQRDCDKGIVV